MSILQSILNWFKRSAPVTSNVVGSLFGKYAGTNLTGAEREANDWTAQREDTFHQRSVADMQAAGLNPALMYGNGASGASPSASVSPGSADPMSLIQLAMLPEQLKQMRAQTQQIYADANLKRQETEYKREMSAYQNLLNQYLPERNAAEVYNIWQVGDANKASAALAWANEAYRNKENKYYDDFAALRMALLDAQSSNYESDTALKKVQEEFERIQKNYAQSTGTLMSSSEKIAIAEYLCGLLGINPRDAKKVFPSLEERAAKARQDRQINRDNRKLVKSGTSGVSAHGGSR